MISYSQCCRLGLSLEMFLLLSQASMGQNKLRNCHNIAKLNPILQPSLAYESPTLIRVFTRRVGAQMSSQ